MNPSKKPEAKVTYGSAAAVVTGLVTWVLVTYVWKNGLPDEVATVLPYLVAWVLGTAAAYLAPHTHRPDLAPRQRGTASLSGTGTASTTPPVAAAPPLPPATPPKIPPKA